MPAFPSSPASGAADSRTPVLVGAGGGYAPAQLETAFIDGGTSAVYTGDLFQDAALAPASLAAALSFRIRHVVPVFIQQVGIRSPRSTPVPSPTP